MGGVKKQGAEARHAALDREDRAALDSSEIYQDQSVGRQQSNSSHDRNESEGQQSSGRQESAGMPSRQQSPSSPGREQESTVRGSSAKPQERIVSRADEQHKAEPDLKVEDF